MSHSASLAKAIHPRQTAAVLLFISLLTNSLFAAPESILYSVNRVEGIGQDLQHFVASTNLWASLLSFDTFKDWLRKIGKRQDALDRIVISPNNEDGLTIMQDEPVVLSAIGVIGEEPVNGVGFKWAYQDAARTRPVVPMMAGIFRSRKTGRYVVIATAENGQQASINVSVIFNEGAATKRIIEKNPDTRTPEENQFVAKLVERGAIQSREISSTKNYTPEAERAIYGADRQKRAEIRNRQLDRIREHPTPPDNVANPGTPWKCNEGHLLYGCDKFLNRHFA